MGGRKAEREREMREKEMREEWSEGWKEETET